jgi:hypothetical protein
MVGASGGIYGLLIAYGLIFSERQLLFMMIFPMKAKHFVWVLAGIEFMTTVFSGRGGLSSAAHVGGMVAGFAALWVRASLQIARKRRVEALTRRPGTASKAKKSKKGHLKLIIDNEKEGPAAAAKNPLEEDESGPKTWH